MAVTTLALFNLGGEEVLVILVLFVLLFGADKAPQVARQIGRVRGELSRAQQQVQQAIQSEEDRMLDEQLKFEAMREQHIAQQDAELFQLKRAAEELGIDITGKSRDELRAAIAAKVAGEPPAGPEETKNAAGAQQ